MKSIALTRGYVAFVDDEDFDRLSVHRWSANIQRRKDGSIRVIYGYRNRSRKVGRGAIYLHREVLQLGNSAFDVDHIDHDGLNNTKSNLRPIPHSLNIRHQRTRSDNTSGIKGVTLDRHSGKWIAQSSKNGKHIWLGSYLTIGEAEIAYRTATDKLFAEVNT